MEMSQAMNRGLVRDVPTTAATANDTSEDEVIVDDFLQEFQNELENLANEEDDEDGDDHEIHGDANEVEEDDDGNNEPQRKKYKFRERR